MTEMSTNVSSDYKYLLTENFKFDFSGGFRDLSLISKGYFVYHACGYSCWSMREYEALAHRTIPIIVGDGTIQAFEKFIDWTAISVKISNQTWFNTSLRNRFRRLIRNASDEFRSALQIDKLKFKNLEKSLLNPYIKHDKISMKNTLIYKKIKSISTIVDWFDYTQADFNLANQLVPPLRSAYNLILVEIWCKVIFPSLKKPEKFEEACLSNPDYVARKEYL